MRSPRLLLSLALVLALLLPGAAFNAPPAPDESRTTAYRNPVIPSFHPKASQRAKENLEKLYRLVDICQVVPFDLECAKVFGTIKSKLRSLGRPTGEMDGLIAATAMAHKATLITAEKKHFENIEGLKVEVWPVKE